MPRLASVTMNFDSHITKVFMAAEGENNTWTTSGTTQEQFAAEGGPYPVEITFESGYELDTVTAENATISDKTNVGFSLSFGMGDNVTCTITSKQSGGSTLQFKHFYDAGTIGSGTIKFRHYSQTEPTPQGYKLTLATVNLLTGTAPSLHMSNADGTSTTVNALSAGMSWKNVKSFYIVDESFSVKYVTINGTSVDMPTEATPYTLTQDTELTYDNVCLTGDMLVTLADGSEKQICELQSDDTYLVYDFATGDFATATAEYIDAVNGHSGKFADKYQKYTFEDGTVIKEVHKHRFLNLRKMEFINLCDWEIGDRIYKIDGTTPALISKEIITERVEHFTIMTSKYQNAFVQGCLSGNRYTQKYEIKMVDGKPVYDFSKPHTMDYLYGKVPQND